MNVLNILSSHYDQAFNNVLMDKFNTLRETTTAVTAPATKDALTLPLPAVPIDPKLEAHREQVWQEIATYYADNSLYSNLTQRDHALQCAHQAAEAGASPEVIVGSLLHDIGWKLAKENPAEEAAMTADAAASVSISAPDEECVAAKLGILHHCAIGDGAKADQLRAQHDVIGACWLRMRGFHEDVAHVVEGHVLAKRYLCFVEPDYFTKLSDGSKNTLRYQGGPMTAEEKVVFDSDPLQAQCLALRRWDEGAKRPGWKVPDFDV